MTVEIFVVLCILVAAVYFFISERLRVDVVALLVLGSLSVSRLVSPEEALSGFSNPAVITIWAVFILSGGLSRTGIANRIGKFVLRLAGSGEARLIVVIMITAGLMSSFMNNIGVAALLLPVVLDISRQTQRPPSKLLLPLVYGALLGGMLTLIGTPPNIIISQALGKANLTPLDFFDFTLPGLLLLLVGTIFMVLAGRHLLPVRDSMRAITSKRNGAEGQALYGLNQRLAEVHLPDDSTLAGKSLAHSRIGRALGLNILAVMRNGHRQLAPLPETMLQSKDGLLVLGRLDRLEQLSRGPNIEIVHGQSPIDRLEAGPSAIARFRVEAGSPYVGKSLTQLDLRRALGINVLALRRGSTTRRDDLSLITLQQEDTLLVQGQREMIALLNNLPDFQILTREMIDAYQLPEHLLLVRVPPGSVLVDSSLAESRLGDTFGLSALTLDREGQSTVPDPDLKLQAEDVLIVIGAPRDLEIIRGLQGLRIKQPVSIDLSELTNGPVALVEAMLSPFTTLTDKTIRELNFRERYGLNVIAIWRGGRPYRTNLGDMALRLGDAMLLYGSREKINLLGQEPDFLVLQEEAQAELNLKKAPVAGVLMAAVIVTVLLGWLPISVAAVIGAALMVVTGCLDMEEAYRFIEWKAVFLIAGMLPLGIAMENSGAAALLAEGIVTAAGGLGPHVMLAIIFLLSVLATLFMPNPVVAVLMAPIALSAAEHLQVSPYTFMVSVAFGASASFLSPVGHPASVLVMGPGGYRFADYIKVGLPMLVLLMIALVIIIPIFWPFAL